MPRVRSIKGMVVNKARCATCPFNDHGILSIREKVQERCLTLGSQLCHHTDNKTLCRGARDFQLQVLHRMGLLKEPTDECWDKMCKELGL